jgi:hypothetical protein
MALEINPSTIHVPVEQLRQMEADRIQVQQLLAQKELDATAANIRAEAALGRADNLARSHRAEVEAERAKASAFATKAELSRALASQPLVPGGAEQLTSLWSNQLRADQTADGYSVRTDTFQDVPTFVASQLSKPEYAHYRRDTQPAPPVGRPAPTVLDSPAVEPRNHGEYLVMMAQQQRQAAEAKNSATDPRLDPSQSFGLGSRKGPAWGGSLFGRGR